MLGIEALKRGQIFGVSTGAGRGVLKLRQNGGKNRICRSERLRCWRGDLSWRSDLSPRAVVAGKWRLLNIARRYRPGCDRIFWLLQWRGDGSFCRSDLRGRSALLGSMAPDHTRAARAQKSKQQKTAE